jgi:hypothetical protein
LKAHKRLLEAGALNPDLDSTDFDKGHKFAALKRNPDTKDAIDTVLPIVVRLMAFQLISCEFINAHVCFLGLMLVWQ